MWPMIFMMAMQAGSSYMQGRARAQELKGQEAMSKYNAKVAEMDAAAAARKTDFDQMMQLRESERVMGRLRAEQGASGARTDVGGPLAVRSAQWAELELDRFLIGLEGRTQVSKFKSEAALHRMQAKIHGKGAKNAILTGMLGAGASMAQGYAMGVGAGYWGQSSTAASAPATSPSSATLSKGSVQGPFIGR
jgi:hypothetical protein